MIREGGEELKALKMGREVTGMTDDGMLEQLLGPAMHGKKKKRKRTKNKKSEHLGSPSVTDERPDQVHTVVSG
jgi:hypothetical protein